MTLNTQEGATKTTFYISSENKSRMDRLISSRKKTQFINRALDIELKKLEDMQRREDAIEAINSIVPIESDEPIVETIRKMRDQREEQLLNNLEND